MIKNLSRKNSVQLPHAFYILRTFFASLIFIYSFFTKQSTIIIPIGLYLIGNRNWILKSRIWKSNKIQFHRINPVLSSSQYGKKVGKNTTNKMKETKKNKIINAIHLLSSIFDLSLFTPPPFISPLPPRQLHEILLEWLRWIMFIEFSMAMIAIGCSCSHCNKMSEKYLSALHLSDKQWKYKHSKMQFEKWMEKAFRSLKWHTDGYDFKVQDHQSMRQCWIGKRRTNK